MGRLILRANSDTRFEFLKLPTASIPLLIRRYLTCKLVIDFETNNIVFINEHDLGIKGSHRRSSIAPFYSHLSVQALFQFKYHLYTRLYFHFTRGVGIGLWSCHLGGHSSFHHHHLRRTITVHGHTRRLLRDL